MRKLACILSLPLLLAAAPSALSQAAHATQFVSMPAYTVAIEPGTPPRIRILRHHQEVFAFPVIAGLASPTQQEQLSHIVVSLSHSADGTYTLHATAASNLWTSRSFEWRFYPDHIEFQQFAAGHGPLGRAYFLSNGVSDRWDKGTTSGHLWDMRIDADRYFAPNPNHANQFQFNIAMPQILGFSVDRQPSTEQDFRPERMTGIFAPPPLFLAFHLDHTWTSIGIGTTPGDYQFPALEYTGSRYAGASLFVDYMGYRAVNGSFASPVLAIHFAYAPLDALADYTSWLNHMGFATKYTGKDVLWHHLPIFCGWAEQTTESVPHGVAPNTLSTQANYTKWIATLDQRDLPVGTIVIDDKWQKNYGTFEVDTKKWPDLKAFIAEQHRQGRHVLLWVPLADSEGLPPSLCVMAKGKCVVADVGNPAYESFLRARIHHLVADIGVDGFKEDWVGAPAVPGLPLSGGISGIEFVRRFQWILWSQAHKDKPDAMVETQTPNALFRESSDLIRLNDIWYATRNVPRVMRLRARIAYISGWPLVDTDNASSTTLKEWWDYAQAQPSIGIPALYFVSRTESTQESPTPAQWSALAGIWRTYIASVKKQY